MEDYQTFESNSANKMGKHYFIPNSPPIVSPTNKELIDRIQKLREALAAMLEHGCLTVDTPCRGERCTNCKDAKKILEETK